MILVSNAPIVTAVSVVLFIVLAAVSIIDAPGRRPSARALRDVVLPQAVVFDVPVAVRYWRPMGRWSRRPLFGRRLIIRERSVQVVVDHRHLARISGPGRLFDSNETTMTLTGGGDGRFFRECIVLCAPFADHDNLVALSPADLATVWSALTGAGVVALSESPVAVSSDL